MAHGLNEDLLPTLVLDLSFLDSGQVLDYGFASKISVPCNRQKQKLSEESEEFRAWYASVLIVLRITLGPVGPWKRRLPGDFGAIHSVTICDINL